MQGQVCQSYSKSGGCFPRSRGLGRHQCSEVESLKSLQDLSPIPDRGHLLGQS